MCWCVSELVLFLQPTPGSLGTGIGLILVYLPIHLTIFNQAAFFKFLTAKGEEWGMKKLSCSISKRSPLGTG